MLSRFTHAALVVGVLLAASPLLAQTALPPVTIGAGLQTSFVHDSPDAGDSTDKFLLGSARLYLSGPVTDKIKFMFNSEYDGASNKIGVMDAVARFEMSPKVNIWAGRFLPPSDRANLYGPYYSHHWAVYTDGIQDGYPFIFQGRDNGVVTYWGSRQGETVGRRLRWPSATGHGRPRRGARFRSISGIPKTATT